MCVCCFVWCTSKCYGVARSWVIEKNVSVLPFCYTSIIDVFCRCVGNKIRLMFLCASICRVVFEATKAILNIDLFLLHTNVVLQKENHETQQVLDLYAIYGWSISFKWGLHETTLNAIVCSECSEKHWWQQLRHIHCGHNICLLIHGQIATGNYIFRLVCPSPGIGQESKHFE